MKELEPDISRATAADEQRPPPASPRPLSKTPGLVNSDGNLPAPDAELEPADTPPPIVPPKEEQ